MSSTSLLPEISWNTTLLWILVLYYLVLNVALYAAMAMDKTRAVKNRRRIPEKTLFLMAVLGGGIGGFVGMFTRHHKTKHIDFYVVYAITTVMHILLWFLLWAKIIFV